MIKANPTTTLRQTASVAPPPQSLPTLTQSVDTHTTAAVVKAPDPVKAASLYLEFDQERNMKVLKDAYLHGMGDIGRKLLSHGVRLDIVVRVTAMAAMADIYEPKKPKIRLLPKSKNGKAAIQPPMAEEIARRASKDKKPPPTESLDPVYSHLDSPQLKHLKWLNSVHMKASKPEKPPDDLSGHVLLCVLGPRTETGNTRNGSNLRCGIEHFVRPLRRGPNPMPIVVLAPSLPLDWYGVVEFGSVYFVEGSPLSLFDLERAWYKNATAVVVQRGASPPTGTEVHTADAEIIFATRLIEFTLPPHSNVPIICELLFDPNYIFVPMSKLALTAPLTTREPLKTSKQSKTKTFSRETRGMPVGGILGLVAAQGADVTGTSDDMGGAWTVETSEYYRQPRYASGQLFVSSIVTNLAVGALYNPSLTLLVRELLAAQMLLVPVPLVWENHAFGELHQWLLTEKNLLVLGLYRTQKMESEESKGAQLDSGLVSLSYFFMAPPASDTRVLRTDRALCLAPSM